MDTEGTIMVQASDFSYYGHLTSHKENGNIKLQMHHTMNGKKLKEILETT